MIYTGSMVDNLVGNIKCVDLDHHAEPQPNTNSSNNNTASNANKQPSSGGHSNMHSKNKVMDPGDAPMHTCRGRLVRHMTSLDSQLKRCAAELVFLLCNEDRKYAVHCAVYVCLCVVSYTLAQVRLACGVL